MNHLGSSSYESKTVVVGGDFHSSTTTTPDNRPFASSSRHTSATWGKTNYDLWREWIWQELEAGKEIDIVTGDVVD